MDEDKLKKRARRAENNITHAKKRRSKVVGKTKVRKQGHTGVERR